MGEHKIVSSGAACSVGMHTMKLEVHESVMTFNYSNTGNVIWGSHSGGYEELYLLGYKAVLTSNGLHDIISSSAAKQIKNESWRKHVKNSSATGWAAHCRCRKIASCNSEKQLEDEIDDPEYGTGLLWYAVSKEKGQFAVWIMHR
jgi:hypothetical protein